MKAMAGVVLCGGRGRRMGADKALMHFEGQPLVLRVAGLLAEAADPVFLAPGRRGRLGDVGYTELEDIAPDTGPLSGLAAALEASPHTLVAVVAVDMPFANARLLRLLARLHTGEDAVVPVTASGLEPLHAVYSTSALPEARLALSEGRLGARRLLERLSVREVSEREWRRADPSGRFATNVNSPKDLASRR
jgi:molybdenum cofactor guanylyltransferase